MTEEQSPKRAKTDPEQGKVAEDVIDLDAEEPEVENEADAVLEQELRNAQAQLNIETEELVEKLRQIEWEYEKRKWPLYKARGDVIKKIPGFWLHCFLQHEDLRIVLGSIDQEILSSLTELEVQSFDDPKAGYKLVLRFAENEFFEDEIVQKEVRYLQEGSEPMHCYVAPCRLKWKNEDPTIPKPMNPGKRGRETAPFFRWIQDEAEYEPGVLDPIADIIQEQLWANPLQFMDAEVAEEDFEQEPFENEFEGDEGQDPGEVWDLEGEEGEEFGGGEEGEDEEYEEDPEGELGADEAAGQEGEFEEYEDEEEGGEEAGEGEEPGHQTGALGEDEPGGEAAELEA